MRENEGYIEVPGGKVWYRAVSPDTETGATPLLCLHGGPGFTHYYLEPLEAMAEHRPVIFYDQLGCGRSDRPGDVSLWTVDRFVAELAQVRSALHLDRLHLFGSSWGGMLYNTMDGLSEFTVTGTLKTWDITDRLPDIKVLEFNQVISAFLDRTARARAWHNPLAKAGRQRV